MDAAKAIGQKAGTLIHAGEVAGSDDRSVMSDPYG
jgi:hypothetical protein